MKKGIFFSIALALVAAGCGGETARANTADSAADAGVAVATTDDAYAEEAANRLADEAHAAVGAAQEVPVPEGATAEMVASGKEIYNGNGICFTCHGQEGAGTQIGPALNDSEWLHSDGSYEKIIETISTGVMEPKEFAAPMPAKGGSTISDDDVKAVAAYVWSLSQGG